MSKSLFSYFIAHIYRHTFSSGFSHYFTSESGLVPYHYSSCCYSSCCWETSCKKSL